MTEKDPDSTAFQEMEDFRREINRMIREFYVDGNPMSVFSRREWMPPADVFECMDFVVVRMEIAGLDEDDVSVTLDGDHLIVSGKREDRHEERPVVFHQMEIKYTHFRRVFLMPASIDEKRVDAGYANGFLTIRIGKRDSNERHTRKIQIEVKG